MKRILYLYVLFAFLALSGFAQSASKTADSLKGGPTLPTKCNPATSGSKADVFVKTGTSAGVYYCSAANTYTILAGGGGGGTGDVVGPASATDNAVVRFDGTTGKLVQDSAVTIADTTGDITAGKYNKVTITAPATGSTLTILNGKTLTANNTLTLAGTDSTVMTFPSTSATIARTDAANTFTGTQTVGALVATTVNGNTFTAGTYTLTGAAGKTLTFSNTLTLAGTDGSTLNVGAGGTLGSAAFTAASAYEVPLSFSTGLSRSTNTITVDQSFAPTWSGAHIHTSTIALTSTTAANNKITQGAAINIGTSSTDGIVLQNTTVAAAGAQQWSPRLHFIGQGWKTNATAASQTVDWIAEAQPVQGTSAPTANFVISSQINAGGYTPQLQLGTDQTAFLRANTVSLDTNDANHRFVQYNGSSFTLSPSGVYNVVIGGLLQIGTSNDLNLRRSAAANLVFGAADNATPIAYTLTLGESSRGGTDSNVAGANGTIRPGNGTGTGGSGSFKIQVAPAGSTGTTANTYADALSIANTKVATFSGAINGTTANFSGAITVASCTGCGGGTTISASGQGIWIPDVFYDADSFEGVASGNGVKFYRFINPVAVTADRADLKGVVAQASGKFSFSLRSWDCTTTTYFDSGVMDTTSWSNVDVTQTLSSNTLPAGGICLMWTHDNTTSKTRVVGPQGNTMAVWNIPASGTKRLGTCSNTSSAGVLPGSCGTETGSNTQGVFQFTLRKN